MTLPQKAIDFIDDSLTVGHHQSARWTGGRDYQAASVFAALKLYRFGNLGKLLPNNLAPMLREARMSTAMFFRQRPHHPRDSLGGMRRGAVLRFAALLIKPAPNRLSIFSV